jgi:hypothetical protein
MIDKVFTAGSLRAHIAHIIGLEFETNRAVAEEGEEGAARLADVVLYRLEEAGAVHYPGDIRVVEVAKGLRMLKAGDMWVTEGMAWQLPRVDSGNDLEAICRVQMSGLNCWIGHATDSGDLVRAHVPSWNEITEEGKRAFEAAPLIVLADHA